MTRRPAPAGWRAFPDRLGIGFLGGRIGPIVSVVALAVIASVTLGLLNGQLPSHVGLPGTGGTNGAVATPAPSNVVIAAQDVTFPGSIVYVKAGNIWIQTVKSARQLTDGGMDSMPSFAPDGAWIYFIRIQEGRGRFPTGGYQGLSWYDLETPVLMRIRPDGSGPEQLLVGRFVLGTSTWFYWLRQPVPSPDGKTITVISDGPNPLQSDIVAKSFSLATRKLTPLGLPESLALGHQDPAWRPDGRSLLIVQNLKDLTRGAPQIDRYDPTTRVTTQLTGPGYLAPAWSPDGAFIAATKTDAFSTDVVILDATGTEVLRVTSDQHSFSPVWSPAGDAIAYLHLEGTIVDLRLARLSAAAGRWTVADTVALTQVSGLDAASRPSWYAPPAELPAPTAPPASSAGSSSAAPASGSTAP